MYLYLFKVFYMHMFINFCDIHGFLVTVILSFISQVVYDQHIIFSFFSILYFLNIYYYCNNLLDTKVLR